MAKNNNIKIYSNKKQCGLFEEIQKRMHFPRSKSFQTYIIFLSLQEMKMK